ncbi:MAG: peptidylprolyl isomerase [Halieaceae bacterium]|jgi:peptidyl-prolyl cis-trans isomerase A (cyclophilin A)|uniref:peptidylprolyl isomerase n=1 Tax=Haliea alexandrii TaxID=2448162 RepID=UPI000F0B611C|nr:peptidylprolyl isomerase [Haliea alexandrii]MCR9186817.1 peptidylprolyl isomerase [Halieaceae bacterium]
MAFLDVVTELGHFSVLLRPDEAPVTCGYFASLARSGAFQNGSIFRIVSTRKHGGIEKNPIDVVQVGMPAGMDAQRTRIQHEHTALTTLRHERWTVSAARFDPGEVYGSFFVCLEREPALDFGGNRHGDGQGFAAFGSVVSGQSTIEQAHLRAEEDTWLTTRIAITDVLYRD